MINEIWFFVVADDRERRISHATCEFMGMYADLMNAMATEHFGHDWMHFSTFTQRDFDPNLHAELNFDPNELPVMRKRHEVTEGLEMLRSLRAYLIDYEKTFIKNEWVRIEDFDSLIVDFNTAIACLENGEAIGEKWFLNVDLEENE